MTTKNGISVPALRYYTTVVLVRDFITPHILAMEIISESAHHETPRVRLTATFDCQGETPAQEPVLAVVVGATAVVVGRVVEVVVTLVLTVVVDVTGLLVVIGTDPLVNAAFTETSYLLLAVIPLINIVTIGFKRTQTIGLGHVPQHHAPE